MHLQAASRLEGLLTALCTCSLEPLRDPARHKAASLCRKLKEQLEPPSGPSSSIPIATERNGKALTRPLTHSLDAAAAATSAEPAGVEGANGFAAGMSTRLPMDAGKKGPGTQSNGERATPLAQAQCSWMGVLLPDSRRLVDVTAIPGSLHSCCAHQRPGANLAPPPSPPLGSLASHTHPLSPSFDFLPCPPLAASLPPPSSQGRFPTMAPPNSYPTAPGS
jgi:hypothetical protein